MSEASLSLMPIPLRVLFVTILCYCEPADPKQLFDEFKNCLIEDFINQGYSEEHSIYLCIQSLTNECKQNGCDISYFIELPHINEADIVPIPGICAVNTEPLWPKLNQTQLNIGETIINTINNNFSSQFSKCFYIDGPGGSGKTFLYNALIQKCKSINLNVLCVAWTGIAASLLPGGMTCHSAFQLPLNLDRVTFPRLTKTKRTFLTAVDVIIWDEAPMASGIALEIVDLIFQDLCGSSIPFGGKLIILGGDFRQVLPVLPGAPRGSIIKSSIKYSKLWRCFKVFKLNENMRASNDSTFSSWLLNCGNGSVCDLVFRKTQYSIEIPVNCVSTNIVADIFGDSFESLDYNSISKFAILSPKNDQVNKINEDILTKMVSDAVSFSSIDSVKGDDPNDVSVQASFPVEYLNSITPTGFPAHILNLKKVCVLMLLRNLSISSGLCNGTRLILDGWTANSLRVRVLSGSYKNNVYFLPRITLSTADDVRIPFNMCRHQFPVRLAYAMTINKAQGQTFDRVGVYLPSPCFSHGQFYTACSRVTHFGGLKIQVDEGSRQGKKQPYLVTVTDNVVYPEIFADISANEI